MPDGTSQKPGSWNRFAIEVGDLAATFEKLRKAGVDFRNDIVTGVGGKQISPVLIAIRVAVVRQGEA